MMEDKPIIFVPWSERCAWQLPVIRASRRHALRYGANEGTPRILPFPRRTLPTRPKPSSRAEPLEYYDSQQRQIKCVDILPGLKTPEDRVPTALKYIATPE